MIENKIYGLGIDTGGTYTDAVIMDISTKEIISKCKSLTTHQDLSIGIFNVLESVFLDCPVTPEEISLTGISTTLATNSILEDKGGEVGLILIGWNPMRDVHFGEKHQVMIKGGYDHLGKAVASLDMEEVQRAIETVSKDVNSIAVSGLFSVCNAHQEKTVKKMITETCGLPAVAGHELSAVLGIDLRTETAVLNGKLIPVVKEFLDDVENTFRAKGIKSSIMVYKGDGSVMGIEQARLHPVETILSGPAASAMGGKIISGLEECVVVDIGGTSTDIAVLEEGFPMIQFEGASVGRWRTRVKAVDMWTVALGGDSHIRLKKAKLQVGPDRAIPICKLTEDYPEIIPRMAISNNFEYCVLNREPEAPIGENESRIVQALRENGPLSVNEIRNAAEGLWMIDEPLQSLQSEGIISWASLTPTDILVFLGEMEMGSSEGVKVAIHALAEKMGMEDNQVGSMVLEHIRNMISSSISKKLLSDELNPWSEIDTCDSLIRKMTTYPNKGIIHLQTNLTIPLIGVGAPSRMLMADIDRRMGCDVFFPEHFEVANAVGAVCSKISESLSATVQPTLDFRFVANVPFIGPTEYSHFESALEGAKSSLIRHLVQKVECSGGSNIKVYSKVNMNRAQEGKFGHWDNVAARNLNYAEVNVRVVGDPPLPKVQS